MTIKPLASMSLGELSQELRAARAARQAADYQDGLANWREATDAAADRVAAVEAEIDRRLAALGPVQNQGKQYG